MLLSSAAKFSLLNLWWDSSSSSQCRVDSASQRCNEFLYFRCHFQAALSLAGEEFSLLWTTAMPTFTLFVHFICIYWSNMSMCAYLQNSTNCHIFICLWLWLEYVPSFMCAAKVMCLQMCCSLVELWHIIFRIDMPHSCVATATENRVE